MRQDVYIHDSLRSFRVRLSLRSRMSQVVDPFAKDVSTALPTQFWVQRI
jgi:hypothetical protein